MADAKVRQRRGPLFIRAESGRFLVPSEIGGKIENMVETEEGTLRSIEGGCAYQADYSDGTPDTGSPYTNRTHGVFHAKVNNNDILLLHVGAAIWVHRGWNPGWSILIGNTGSEELTAEVPNETRPRFPTQFESTDSGVIIVPASGRAFFYDGYCALPFGYSDAPGPPTIIGPADDEDWTNGSGDADWQRGANATGYSHHKRPADQWTSYLDTDGAGEMLIGRGRVGSVSHEPGADGAAVGPSEYRGVQQWIDRWGNLSPVSGESNPVGIRRKVVYGFQNELIPGEYGLVQLAWVGLDPGPEGTVGRILGRTRDILNAGTTKKFEMPADAQPGGAFATITDNVSTLFPDNTPDSWLLQEMLDVVAVPEFRLVRAAFGRAFIANTVAEPGIIRWSMPGRWGTFLAGDELFPDSAGREITGLASVPGGLLAFTEASTFLIVPSDDGLGFKSAILQKGAGCVAPSSIGTMPSGMVIWLGREGFYAYDGETVQLISEDIARDLRSMSLGHARIACAAVDVQHKEYRCWVPLDGDRFNNTCFVWTEAGWRRRNEVAASGVCVTQDHRAYMLACGRISGNDGLWVLDHESNTWPREPQSTFETSWIRVGESATGRSSARTVYVWLRETQNRRLQVEIMKNYRDTVIESSTDQLRAWPEDDAPAFWGTATYDASDTTWARRRPFLVRYDFSISSEEVFKIRIKSPTGDNTPSAWEFIGLSIDEVPKPFSTRVPP